AQAVAKQKYRQAGLCLANDGGEPVQVVDHAVPAVGAGDAGPVQGARGAAVAAVVVGVDHKARGGKAPGEAGVAGAVFGGTVGDLYRGPGFAVRGPAMDVDVSAGGIAEGKGGFIHRITARRRWASG